MRVGNSDAGLAYMLAHRHHANGVYSQGSPVRLIYHPLLLFLLLMLLLLMCAPRPVIE